MDSFLPTSRQGSEALLCWSLERGGEEVKDGEEEEKEKRLSVEGEGGKAEGK